MGVEHHIWAQVEGGDQVFAIANEDLERSTEDKTSAVHFLRFEFDEDAVAALKKGVSLSFGVDHDRYRHEAQVARETAEALLEDFD